MESLLSHCRSAGLRITIGLKAILEALHGATVPQSLQDLENNAELAKLCDRATIFRTLQRLEGIGLLRRLNFSHSGAKFSLNTGEGHKEYLICKNCGDVRELAISCPVHKLESDLADKLGFTEMSHELTFYGLCPKCSSLQ